MKKHTKGILEEINRLGQDKNNDLLVETTADNIIESAINLMRQIEENYDEETADKLERRFINSIRNGDPRKFKRSIRHVMENRNNENY